MFTLFKIVIKQIDKLYNLIYINNKKIRYSRSNFTILCVSKLLSLKCHISGGT